MRRFGEPAAAGRVYSTRLGAYAIIRDGGDVLVTEQAKPEREYQLPGGGADPDEGLLRALHRECLEETGWKILVLRRLGAFQRFTLMPEYRLWARKVCHIYLARPTLWIGAPADDAHRAIWMPLGTAIGLIANDGDRHFLAREAARISRPPRARRP